MVERNRDASAIRVAGGLRSGPSERFPKNPKRQQISLHPWHRAYVRLKHTSAPSHSHLFLSNPTTSHEVLYAPHFLWAGPIMEARVRHTCWHKLGSANIEDLLAFLLHFLPTRYRSISIEVLAAIGERIRRDVENTHNRGAISEFNSQARKCPCVSLAHINTKGTKRNTKAQKPLKDLVLVPPCAFCVLSSSLRR